MGLHFLSASLLLTTLVAAAFVSRAYGSAFGRAILVMKPVALVALCFIGAVYDRTGSYDVDFWTFGVVVFVGILLVWAVRRLPG